MGSPRHDSRYSARGISISRRAVERELSRARVAVMQAALDSLNGETSPAATMAREKYAAARKVAEDQNEPQAATKYDELRLRAIATQRAALQRGGSLAPGGGGLTDQLIMLAFMSTGRWKETARARRPPRSAACD
jgi:hypothetical protein